MIYTHFSTISTLEQDKNFSFIFKRFRRLKHPCTGQETYYDVVPYESERPKVNTWSNGGADQKRLLGHNFEICFII